MTWRRLLRRNLTYYWRTNFAVVAGVTVAVAVLAGALLVGDSVRASLRDLVLLRLGETSFVLTSDGFFREQLAAGLEAQPGFRGTFRAAVPLIALHGVVLHENSRRRASNVLVYGVDARFWHFHGRPAPASESSDALLSAPLADELGAAVGDSLLVRVEKPSAIPLESLHSHKDDLGRALRLRVREALPADALGEFSVSPQQAAVRAVFVSLERLQRDLGLPAKVNGILVSEPVTQSASAALAEAARQKLVALLRDSFALEDLGVRIVELACRGAACRAPQQPPSQLSIESDRLILDDRLAEAARSVAAGLGWNATPVFTYLANSIRIGPASGGGDRQIPYSLVTALDGEELASLSRTAGLQTGNTLSTTPSLWLNDWAWRDLGAQAGDRATLDYFVWQEGGRLETRSAEFVVRGRVPMDGLGGDRHLAPSYPGISDSPTLDKWDPPFPVDLRRIRPRDEDYWRQYRTAPKAFIPLAVGQSLWQSRFGKLTAVRLDPAPGVTPENAIATARQALREKLDPVASGISVYAARAAGAQASRGAVNFSVYFVSFSFFLVISAVLLVGLFFRLGIEQRLKEIGLLEAFGYSSADLRKLFLSEGLVLVTLGSVLGLAGAAGYGALMVYGLRTWWVEAVGTTFLHLEVAPASLLLGFAGGIIAATSSIVWTLASLRSFSPRSLVTGSRPDASGAALLPPAQRAWPLRPAGWGAAAAVLAFALVALASLGTLNPASAFFGAGGLLLTALVTFQWAWLRSRRRPAPTGSGRVTLAPRASVLRMGFRNAAWRPGRSLLCIALMASATFILVAVDAFRRPPPAGSDSLDPRSGTGGFPLLAESLLPIPYDANTPEGRERLNLSADESAALEGVKFFSFRLRPGEDASCLNLYQPQNPRMLGLPPAFMGSGRFAFSSIGRLAQTSDERANPWRLLNAELPDGAVPAIADANSMTYILHRKLGEDFVIVHEGRPVRLRLVAALADSLFQSELLISEENFLRLFPREPGYRFFLIDAPAANAAEISAALEEGLADYGYDVTPAADRLAAFHRVENTYISTFQALGGLGLLLGTLGLAAVMLRNVFERRRELAVLRAAGYRRADLARLILAENSLLLVGGLLTGIVSAAVAVLPALIARGGAPGGSSLGTILAAVVLTGLLASVVALAAALRAPLLASLRSE